VNGKPRDFERFLYGEFAAQETMKFLHEYGIAPRFAYVILEPLPDPARYGETVALLIYFNIGGIRLCGFLWGLGM
jgi:hypothetical protein